MTPRGLVHFCDSMKKSCLGAPGGLTPEASLSPTGALASWSWALSLPAGLVSRTPQRLAGATLRDQPVTLPGRALSSRWGKGGPSTHHRISFLVRKVRAYNKPQREVTCLLPPFRPWPPGEGGNFRDLGRRSPCSYPRPGKTEVPQPSDLQRWQSSKPQALTALGGSTPAQTWREG